MAKDIKINTGEMVVSEAPTKITTTGIGSCVFICVYDDQAKVGGAIHAMIPSRSGGKKNNLPVVGEDKNSSKYVDEAIVKLVNKIVQQKGKKENLKAKMVGGASMFQVFSNSNIGRENVKTAEQILQLLKIPIKNKSVGGKVGRSAVFNLNNGVVEVAMKM